MERAFAWGLLGVLLFVFFGDGLHWAPIVGGTWLIGAYCLARSSPAALAKAGKALAASRAGRISLLVLTALWIVGVWLFGIAAGVLALCAFAAVSLGGVLVRGAEAARDLAAGVATTGTTLLILVLLGEVVLSRPAVGAAWGSPEELASWAERYDRLGREGNLFGFRTSYEQISKPAGIFRIVAIGDSYTWGDKIAATEDVWPARLESGLRSELGQPVQVVNLGRNGYTTVNEVELMNRLGWQYEPDLVLMQFTVNDAFPSSPGFRRAGTNTVFGQTSLLPTRFRQAAAGSSAVLAFVEGRVNSLLHELDYVGLYAEGAEGWSQLQAAVAELGRESAERGIPVVMLLVPRLLPGSLTGGSHPHRTVHDKVRAVAEAAGLAVVDMTPHFQTEGRPAEVWWATPYDAHPNERAHRLVADVMARYLVEREPGLPTLPQTGS